VGRGRLMSILRFSEGLRANLAVRVDNPKFGFVDLGVWAPANGRQ